MRRVRNDRNAVPLSALSREVLQPLFDGLVEVARGVLTSFEGTAAWTSMTQGAQQATTRLLSRKVGGVAMGQALMQYARTSGEAAMSGERDAYMAQGRDLETGAIQQLICAPQWHTFFVTVLYERMFDDAALWSALGFTFNRSIFHANFLADNPGVVCPYCDLTANMSSAGTFIEHFLPKSRFPFLAMHPLNLFEACAGCNGPDGKGDRFLSPLASPYRYEIGAMVEFSLQATSIRLGSKGDAQVSNYVDLLKLDKRYAEERVATALRWMLEAIFATFQESQPDWATVVDYVGHFRKTQPLYYASLAELASWWRTKGAAPTSPGTEGQAGGA